MLNNDEFQKEDLNGDYQSKSLFTQGPSLETQTVDDRALRMMQKMGYKIGAGLGKNEQGIKETVKINTVLGKRGLGLQINNLNLTDELWDFSLEDILVEEKVNWLENCNGSEVFNEYDLDCWMIEGPPNHDVIGNCNFCDQNILENVFKAKDIFEELNLLELCQARAKANPFETVRSVFFMNRAALKMANIDAATDFMFTKMEENAHFKEETFPKYFADVCAGPGGFTEYILWRKQWFYKGFGLTLKDENDFKVSESTCASSVTFQALYGLDEDGNVCSPDNIMDFLVKIRNESEGVGLHFVMSDGGFCVDGKENLQEILSKNIYICQCLLALNILRHHGSFVTKVFDIFTPFSVGLLYLMYLCFDKVGIIKPNSSRPANSERYLVCSDLRVNPLTNVIQEYLWKVVLRLWELRNLPDRDVIEIVPLDVIKNEQKFFKYIVDSNNTIGKRQIIALKKLAQFCRNPTLIDPRQDELRKRCLEYWKIPDKKRKALEICKLEHVLSQVNLAKEILMIQARYIDCLRNLESTVCDLSDWHYCYMFSSRVLNRGNFYVGVSGSKVYRLQNNKWVKMKDIELVQGTLLYGEFVKETSVSMDTHKVSHRYSLHIIDAVYLGLKNLQGLSFLERSNLIKIYSKAVNKESQAKFSVRVRHKQVKELSSLPQDLSIRKNHENGSLIMTLPRLGYKNITETCEINSVLLLKTNKSQSFQSTHVLRAQIYDTKENNKDINSVSFEELAKYVQQKLL